MRFDSTFLLLGLSILSSLPTGSSRALPMSSGALDLHRYNGNTNVPRAAVRVGAPKVGGGGGGGKATGGKPAGGSSPPPGVDRDPSGTPPRLGAKEPVVSKPDGSSGTAHIGDSDSFCSGLECVTDGLGSLPDLPIPSEEQQACPSTDSQSETQCDDGA